MVGNALIASDGKIEFLKMFANWLSDWRESRNLGLSKQMFDALISTSLALADLCSELIHEGYI